MLGPDEANGSLTVPPSSMDGSLSLVELNVCRVLDPLTLSEPEVHGRGGFGELGAPSKYRNGALYIALIYQDKV